MRPYASGGVYVNYLGAEGADRWTGPGYDVLARYDTSGETARVTIADSSKREQIRKIIAIKKLKEFTQQ